MIAPMIAPPPVSAGSTESFLPIFRRFLPAFPPVDCQIHQRYRQGIINSFNPHRNETLRLVSHDLENLANPGVVAYKPRGLRVTFSNRRGGGTRRASIPPHRISAGSLQGEHRWADGPAHRYRHRDALPGYPACRMAAGHVFIPRGRPFISPDRGRRMPCGGGSIDRRMGE